MSELKMRELVVDYMNADMKENEFMNMLALVKCCTCGYVLLAEDSHENCDGIYCETCWEAREEYDTLADIGDK